ncbi:MAG TPA: hypothetical protein VE714_02450 [Gemmatimonadales bacterium]|jgi:hypothetical protein|nr:hypothetical protein [Gemmatimonadales bacterium]
MNRHLIIPLALALLPAALGAQERATTSSGRVVLLYPNGTWKYASPAVTPASAGAGAAEHRRPASAVARLEFAHGKAALYYDPKIWQQAPSDEPGRLRLRHVDGDGYAVVIAERLEMSMDALRDVALTNARSAAPDARIVSQETRRVNGHDVMVMQIEGTIKTIRFIYLGYYYVGPEGTFQLLTYTAANLFKEYRTPFEQLLDGFTLTP